jgi:hypothetical protein
MHSTLRRYLAMVSVLAATAAMSIVTVSPAGAVGANCISDREKKNHTLQLDEFRAKAYCYSINSDTKVRAKLVRNGGPDYTGVWFTGEYIWRYTGWYTCYSGCWDTYELGDR